MPGWTRIVAMLLAFLSLGIGCAPAGPRDSGGAAGSSALSSGATMKRITLGTPTEPDLRPSASAEQITVVGLYYNPIPGAISDRVWNVSRDWPSQYITWNAHEWDVRS